MIKAISVQITIKDGWTINRVWFCTLDEANNIVKAVRSKIWNARTYADANIHVSADAIRKVGRNFGYKLISSQSIDHKPHSEALIHFYKE